MLVLMPACAVNILPACHVALFGEARLCFQGANFAVEQLSATKYDTIQLDWALTPPEARRLVGPGKTIQVQH